MTVPRTPARAPDPLWVREARLDIGQTERLGPNDSDWIRRMWAAVRGTWLLGQPWCGGAVALWMQRAGLPFPKDYFRAKAWLSWGRTLLEPRVGAVAIFEREGGGHVGLVVGEDTRGRLMILGGNQSNRISIAPFDKARLAGLRWPHGPELPARGAGLPITVASGSASTNEA